MNSSHLHSTNLKRTTMSMSHFLFPPTLFTHGFCQLGGESSGPEDHTRDKMSKSFTIDSLLGLSNAAARAVFQNGIAQHHQSAAINLANSIRSDCWRFDNECEYSDIGESRTALERGSIWFPHYNSHSTALSQDSQPRSNSSTQPSANQNFSARQAKTPNSGKVKKGDTGLGKATIDKSTADPSPPQSIRRATKTKRVRTIFTPEQLERLEAEFERQQYMVGPERLYLASSLNLTEAQVKVWFQNRRIKWRKVHFEMQQQRLAVLRSQHTDFEDEDSCSDFGSSESEKSPAVAAMPPKLESSDTMPSGSVNSPDREDRLHKTLGRN